MLVCTPAAAFANPVIEGDRPDPTILHFKGRWYAASTTSAWAPLFPIVRSDDLVTWREIGAVLRTPPSWGNGRFWAPELVRGPGGASAVLAYWSSSSKGGTPCIGVASAPRPEGPWRDRGRAVCPPGGAIDAAPVTDERGRRWLGWKQLGVGGGIHLQRLSASGLRASGPAPELIRPDLPWERGVTEGASFLRNGGWWYLIYSGGNCCRPPCTYATGVARSRSLGGPYEKLGDPVMRTSAAWRCPGHGTPAQLDDGSWVYLHHGYRPEDRGSVRRLMLLSPVSFGEDGWLRIDGPAPVNPLGAAVPATSWSDDFSGTVLRPGWEWLWDRRPSMRVRGGALRVSCASTSAPAGAAAVLRPAFVARQAVIDRFAAAAVLRPSGGATAFLAVHDHDGALRGLARRADGAVYAFRVTAAGRVSRGPLVRGLGAAAIVSAAPGGPVGVSSGGTTVDPGPAATGGQATRVAVGCWGRGSARFTSVRLRAL